MTVSKARFLGIAFLLFSAVWGMALIVFSVRASYEYDNQIFSYWSLSVKASTLQAKSQYFDQLVQAIQSSHLSGNNALLFKTPDNSYDQNLATLQSAQQRFHDVQSMDPTSFQYSQTMAQISAAGAATMPVFKGLWYKKYYPEFWSWVGTLNMILAVLVFTAGFWMIFLSFVMSRGGTPSDPINQTLPK